MYIRVVCKQDNKYKDIVALASLGQSFINKKETPRKLLLQHATLSHVAAVAAAMPTSRTFPRLWLTAVVSFSEVECFPLAFKTEFDVQFHFSISFFHLIKSAI